MTEHAQFDLAVTMLKETGRKERSVITSPVSVSTALFMVYLAAQGETKEELQKVLGKSDCNLKKCLNQEIYSITKI